MQDLTLTLYSLFVLIISVVIHEVSHGYVAYLFGDVTAKYQGRLTLNPIKHFDLVGTLIVPVLAYLSTGGAATFGWAKPVPINPYNFRNERWGSFAVSIAGVGANLLIAIIFGIIIRIVMISGYQSNHDNWGIALYMLGVPVMTNIVLAVFNLIPVPPFDGFKIVSALFNVSNETVAMLDRYGIIFILIVVFFIWRIVSPIVSVLFALLTGLT